MLSSTFRDSGDFWLLGKEKSRRPFLKGCQTCVCKRRSRQGRLLLQQFTVPLLDAMEQCPPVAAAWPAGLHGGCCLQPLVPLLPQGLEPPVVQLAAVALLGAVLDMGLDGPECGEDTAA